MDAFRLSNKIGINRAADDSGVVRGLLVEPDEMLPVECQHRPSFGASERKHFLVRQRLFGLARLQHGQYVVPPAAEFMDHRLREVLVGMKSCQVTLPRSPGSGFRSLLHGSARKPTRWRGQPPSGSDRNAEVPPRSPRPPTLLQHPHWDAHPHDAGFAAAHARVRLNPRKGIAQIADDPLQQPGLLSSTHAGQQFLSFLNGAHRR